MSRPKITREDVYKRQSYIRLYHMVKALAGIYCASLLALGLKMAFLAMLILFFIIGASTKLLDSTLNAYVSELYPADSSKHLSILHACFGMGALLAPLIIAFLLERNMPARRVFAALGIICLAIQCAYYGVQRACPPPAKTCLLYTSDRRRGNRRRQSIRRRWQGIGSHHRSLDHV